MARLRFISDPIKEIERARLGESRSRPERRSHAMMQLLVTSKCIGIETADMLVDEVN
jgi:hypothetical protein